MRTPISILLLALAAAAPASAATELDSSRLIVPSATTVARSVDAARAFRFDLALSPSAVEARLGRGELLELVDTVAGREMRESASWHYEIDHRTASVLLQRKEGVTVPLGPALPRADLDQTVLSDVQKRLADLGIPSGEAQPPRIRAMRRATKSLDGSKAPATDTVVGYKAFVSRSLAGVPLPESILVFTYLPDGSFRRMYGRWPELAAEGHTLTTSLSGAEIASEVAAQMQPHLAGRTLAGPMPVRLVYAEEQVGDGTVRLHLQAEATVLPAASGGPVQPFSDLVPLSR
jgi:hypothetical protein